MPARQSQTELDRRTSEWEPLIRLRSSEPALIDVWDAWVFAEVESELALAAWYEAPDEEKRHAYTAYVAALDREGGAADGLARRVERSHPREIREVFTGA